MSGISESLTSLPIFVINLERESERRDHMAAELDRLGLRAEFVPAVDGRALDDAALQAISDAKRTLRHYGSPLHPSEIACSYSHHLLYERMLREGIETALILEDDVRLQPELPDVLHALLAHSFQEWMVVRLFARKGRVALARSGPEYGRRVAELGNDSALFRCVSHIHGAAAYLIRRAGAERMIQYGFPFFLPLDHTLDRFWDNGIVPYLIRPFPVIQTQDFGSSIDRELDRRDGQPWHVVAARRLQRARDGVAKRVFNLT